MLKRDLFRVDNCDIGPSTLSDHSPIYLSVHLNGKVRTSLWRLNSNILNNTGIKDKLKNVIKLYLDQNDNEEVTPPILWDALKAVIRGRLISITSYEKKIQAKNAQKPRLDDLKGLQKKHAKSLKDDTKAKISKLKKEIDEINTQEIQKKLIFTKQRYYEAAGKSLK